MGQYSRKILILMTLITICAFLINSNDEVYYPYDVCADFVYILEESNALSDPEDWNLIKQSISNPIDYYTISPNKTRFAVIGYASAAEIQIELDAAQNRHELVRRIDDLPLLDKNGTDDGRNITDAFLKAVGHISEKRRPEVPVYVALVAYGTDNKNSESDLIYAAGLLPDSKVLTYLVVYEKNGTSLLEPQIRAIGLATSGVIQTPSREMEMVFMGELWIGPAVIESPCTSFPCMAEIVLLIDQSASIDDDEYTQYIQPVLLSFASYLRPGTKVKLAIVFMCDPSNTRIVLDFNSTQNISFISDLLQTRNCIHNETALETALNLTYTTLFDDDKPDNQFRFIMIFTYHKATDSYYSNYIPTVEILIHQKNVQIFLGWFGHGSDYDYLMMLTGKHKQRILFVIEVVPDIFTLGCGIDAADLLSKLILECFSMTNQTTTPLVSTRPPVTSPTPDWALYCTGEPSMTTRKPASTPAGSTMTWYEPTGPVSNTFLGSTHAPDMFETMTQSRNLTAFLLLLSKAEVTNNTAESVSETLWFLLHKLGAEMNEEDIFLTSIILYNISIVYPLSDKAFGAAVESVDIILAQDEGTIRRSNFLYGSTQYIEQFFYQSTAHTTSDHIIYDTAKYVFVSIQHVRCGPSSPKEVGAVQYADGGVCVPGPAPMPSNETDVIAFIQLPIDAFCGTSPHSKMQSAGNEEFRTGSVLYRNQKLFGKEDPTAGNASLCDRQSEPKSTFVATMDVMPGDHITDGPVPKWNAITKPVVFGMDTKNSSDHKKLLHAQEVCSYWSNDLGWLSDGCKFAQSMGDVQICQCDHLTDFTLIVDMSEGDPMLCDQTLFTFSMVISIVSLMVLILAIILDYLIHGPLPRKLATGSLIKDLREDAKGKQTVIGWQMASMFIFVLLFLLLSDQRTVDLSKEGCDASAAILYCLLLCTFLWTAFAGINCFKIYVRVFNNDELLKLVVSKKFTLPVTCGIPILITVVIWLTKNEFYSRDDNFCWIRPNEIYVIPAVIVPTSIFIVLDIFLTAMTIKSVRFPKRSPNSTFMQPQGGQKRTNCRFAILLLGLQFALGLPWVAQYFTIGSPTATAVHYVFAFFNGTQGFWLASLYIMALTDSVLASMRKSKVKPSKATQTSNRSQNQLVASGIPVANGSIEIPRMTSDQSEPNQPIVGKFSLRRKSRNSCNSQLYSVHL